jgi:hypothetical protein
VSSLIRYAGERRTLGRERRDSVRGSLAAVAAVASVVVATAGAQATPPQNDERASAQPLAAGRGVAVGTTVGASVEDSDPRRACRTQFAATVWYRLGTPPRRTVVVRLVAGGQLAAVVAVYRQRAGKLVALGCDETSDNGIATIGFVGRRGDLVMVGQQAGSRPGRFELRTLVPEASEQPPGRPLRGVARSTVERFLDEEDLWHVDLEAGTAYRLALLSGEGCADVTVISPATKREVVSLYCDDYALFTPGPSGGGRYLVRVEAGYAAGPRPYRLQVARAGPDDTAPGLALRSGVWATGRLDPRGIDHVDLYTFRLERRSDVLVALGRPRPEQVSLLLMTDTGRKVAGGQAERRPLDAGRYFVAVRGEAGEPAVAYRLLLRVRESSLLSVVGSRTPTLGQSIAFTARIGAPAGRFATLQIDRFDPLAGWLFYRTVRLRVGSGDVASLAWTPPFAGRFRARITYPGRSSYVLVDVMAAGAATTTARTPTKAH